MAPVIAVFAAAVLAAAAEPPVELLPIPEPVTAGAPTSVPASFDESKMRWSVGAGANTVTGDAVLRTRGGTVRNCAGTAVELWPISDYISDNLAVFYAVNTQPLDQLKAAEIRASLDPRAALYARTATCNGQGVFTFGGLPNGMYLVIANVTWEVPNFGRSGSKMEMQGGSLGKPVSVSGGQRATVTLTQ